MLKHTLTKLLLASMGFTCSMLAIENKHQDKQTEELSETTSTRLGNPLFQSLEVTDNAKFNHLNVLKKTKLDQHLNVRNNVEIDQHLDVAGSQDNKQDLNVSENQYITQRLNVEKDGTFKNKIIVKNDGILKKNLIVKQNALLQNNAIIKVNASTQDLDVTGNGVIQGYITVDGIVHAESNISVEKNAYIKGYECVGKKLAVNGNETIVGTLTGNNNMIITGELTVDGNESIGGNLTVQENEGISNDLQISGTLTITNNLNVNQNSNISGCLKIEGNNCLDGNLCVNKTIATCTLNTPNLATDQLCANIATIQGTLLVNEIDPILDNYDYDYDYNSSALTFFSGNVSIDRGKKLLVHQISPALNPLCDQDDCGTTYLNSDVGLDPQATLLVNYIDPVKKDPCNPCSSNDGGITCFSGDIAITSTNLGSGPHKLSVNYIDPVTTNALGNCVEDKSSAAATFFSGNVAINPSFTEVPFDDYFYSLYDYDDFFQMPKLLVNQINPVKIDPNTGKYLPDNSTNAMTFFSGNVALDPTFSTTLFVNYIDPVTTDTVTGLSVKDPSPCASIDMSGNMSVKNGYFFGQITGELGCAEPVYLANFFDIDNFPDIYYSPVANQLGFPVTQCHPVLRLNFKNIDPENSPFPQGAWVKLNVFGRANINLLECTEPGIHCPRTVSTDIFSELYFYVGAGSQAPCSSLIGSTTTTNPNSGINALSGFGANPILFSKINVNNTPFTIKNKTSWGRTLFELMPTIKSNSAVTLLGTTATSVTQPQSVDILLMGLLQSYDLDTITFEVMVNGTHRTIRAIDFIDFECPFFIDNMTVFYEIISPNLDPQNPPCFPSPQFDPLVYDQACKDLISTFTTQAPSPNDAPDVDFLNGYDDYTIIFEH